MEILIILKESENLNFYAKYFTLKGNTFMKKIVKMTMAAMIASLTVFTLAGCSVEEEESEIPVVDIEIPTEEVAEESSEEVSEEEVYEETRDGFYRSELTNEWIDESLMNQRPVAIMVDNEVTALDHYGVNSADVVYELMNSTANGRVTRLMCLVKDWEKITQFGSVRSTRPTNVMLAGEWNAILIHDGGPFYINDFIQRDYTNNLNGGFARFSNGKATEFTEYVTYEDYKNPNTGKAYDGLKDRIAAAKYSTEYNSFYHGAHWNFSKGKVDLASQADSIAVTDSIELPFPHNSSKLLYNEETQKYEYYEYGKAHVDPLDDNNITSFENVILQECTYIQHDSNGYLTYNLTGSEVVEGYYITEGEAIPIIWGKISESDITMYINKSTGLPIQLNTGKTYIAIVPADVWDELVLK